MKLPIILSAMLAALAVPNTLASEADHAAAAPAAEESAATEHKDASEHTEMTHKKKSTKKKGHHHKRRHHGHHGGGHHESNIGHTPEQDLAWDDPRRKHEHISSSCSSGNEHEGGKEMPPEVPGQKGPHVPAGQ